MSGKNNSYVDSGVSVDKGNLAEEKIGQIVKKTFNKNVLLGVGSFSAALSLSTAKKLKNPVLCVTIDGAGTKTKVAALAGKWGSIGADVVNHCSNDLLCTPAKPFFFVDYLASSKIDVGNVSKIVEGMANACKSLDCPLVGGETAEMPGVYLDGENDVVGCMVGLAEQKKIFDTRKVKKGDVLLGLYSSGLHTNGYSLARKVLLEKHSLESIPEGFSVPLGDALLAVHKSYSKPVFKLMEKVPLKGIAHITGGGLLENIPRVLPENRLFMLHDGSWKIPAIFQLIAKEGGISDYEMFRTFNMGIGLVIVVSKEHAKKAIDFLHKAGEPAFVCGEVV